MILELNNYGFFNLAKPDLTFDYDINSFKSVVSKEILIKFLSLNEVFLNTNNQVTDGNSIFGQVNLLN